MGKELEYFNATTVADHKALQSIIDEFPSNIYFFGHRLEDDICIEVLTECYDFTFSQQYKDSVVGKVSRERFNTIVDFLKDNFISGYIIWFDNIVDYTFFEFGELFFKSKYTGLLASIYQAKHSSISSYDIDVSKELRGKIRGMVFTESGESGFMLLRPYRP